MMNKLILLLAVLLFASCGVTKKVQEEEKVVIPSVNDEELVKKSFEAYKSAILNDKGEVAVEYVDSRTIAYYAKILKSTKTADSTAIAEMNIMDKLMVLLVRHRTSKVDLLSFDGKKMLVYAIKEGMVGKNSVANNELGNVEVVDDFAKAEFITRGQKSPYHFHFYKENNLWKMDLTAIFPVASVAFGQMVKDSGQGENEYLFYLLEMVTGKAPTSEIWQPIE